MLINCRPAITGRLLNTLMFANNKKKRNKMNTVITTLNHLAAKNFIIRLYKYYIIDSILITKREGFKALLRKRGWKVLAFIIGYYAVRDTLLYVIVPLLIAKSIF